MVALNSDIYSSFGRAPKYPQCVLFPYVGFRRFRKQRAAVAHFATSNKNGGGGQAELGKEGVLFT